MLGSKAIPNPAIEEKQPFIINWYLLPASPTYPKPLKALNIAEQRALNLLRLLKKVLC